MNGFHCHMQYCHVRQGLCLAPERGLIYLLEYRETVVSDRPGVREMPGSGNI